MCRILAGSRVLGILPNHVSVLAISEWIPRQESTLLITLGFPASQDGDLWFCQRTRCIEVKQNQQTLYRDLRLLFDPPASLATRPPTDERYAENLDYV